MQLQKDVLNGTQYEFDLLRVRSARIMRVYLLRGRALIERDEAVEEVITRGLVVIPSLIIGEVVTKRRARELLSEEIDLVQVRE